MSDKLPEGFLSLTDTEMRPDQEVNVIGVIVDCLPPTPTKGNDWQLSLGVQDRSYLSSFNGRSGLRVKFFKKEAHLPKVSGIGDVILLRHIKRSFYSGTPLLVSTWNTEASLFPAATIPEESFKAAYSSDHLVIPHVTTGGKERRPSNEEQLYIIGLRKWAKESIDLSVSIPIPTGPHPQFNDLAPSRNSNGPGNKYRLLKDVSDNAYYDLVGEIVKTWKTDLYTTVYFTDYTSNKQVQPITTGDEPSGADRDGDPHGYTSDIRSRKEWTGPTGQFCLQIFLWPPHSRWANDNLREGDFVLVRNVRIGIRNNSKYLRADLNEDQRHPDQIDIRKINHNDKRCMDMISRRDNYWTQRERQPEKRLSKKQRRKLERKLKAQEAAKSDQADSKSDKENEDSDEELPHKKPFALRSRNDNVVCAHSEQPLLSLDQVLDPPNRAYATPRGQVIRLPFINQNCRIRLRVVDFWPSRLEDFSKPVSQQLAPELSTKVSGPKLLTPKKIVGQSVTADSRMHYLVEYSNCDKWGKRLQEWCTEVPEELLTAWTKSEQADNNDQAESQEYLTGSSPPSKWEWGFGLLVEDAEKTPPGQKPARMSLIVSGMDAEYLLKLTATDLQNDPKTLTDLKEKLFILWGNLLELKSQGQLDQQKPSNKTFECCIREYGVRADEGWLRLHKMFETTIR